jgi:hypothetical protein
MHKNREKLYNKRTPMLYRVTGVYGTKSHVMIRNGKLAIHRQMFLIVSSISSNKYTTLLSYLQIILSNKGTVPEKTAKNR